MSVYHYILELDLKIKNACVLVRVTACYSFFFFLSLIHAKCSVLVSHCDKGTEPKCMFLVH